MLVEHCLYSTDYPFCEPSWNETEVLVKERDDRRLSLEAIHIFSKPEVVISEAALLVGATMKLFLGLT